MSSKSSPALDLFGQLEKAAQDMVREAKLAPKPAIAGTGEKPPAPPANPAPAGGGSGGSSKSPPPPASPSRRPGMYIGGTDEKALHHLFAEVLDNSMDEAVAGHATFIDINLASDGFLTVADNGRGIPVDAHPKFPGKSSLEIVMCTLHAGGKFDGKAYETSGGLHGVGVSVVNALSELVEVEVAREQQLYRMRFSKGLPLGALEHLGAIRNRRGTSVRFKPDGEIFKSGSAFSPARLYKMARSKAYLYRGVEIGFVSSYCNTVPTPDGGTHEAGLRVALLRALKDHAERIGQIKRAASITSDDVMTGAAVMLSVFIREPEFVGQTKDKLATPEASRIVDTAIRDAFDHWLAGNPNNANRLLDFVIERAEDRLRRRAEKDVARKTPVRKLRLPGKLADCTNSAAQGSELFIVEGDSAGGSAKQARDRASQAILPLRGKILNVANAGKEKLQANQQLADLMLALGCGTGSQYREDDLRYGKIIIMTDADVDGAHIASLLITFFYRQMPKLIENGHLFLAVPPLYRITHGGRTVYARDDAHKEELLARDFKGKKPEVGRFKGLGEMMAQQLKETTMDPRKRTLLRVVVPAESKAETDDSVERLMGENAKARYTFIQERAAFAEELVDL